MKKTQIHVEVDMDDLFVSLLDPHQHGDERRAHLVFDANETHIIICFKDDQSETLDALLRYAAARVRNRIYGDVDDSEAVREFDQRSA